MHLQVFKSKLSGVFQVPPSKSHSIRAIVFAAFSSQVSHLENVLMSGDTKTAIAIFENFGCKLNVTQLAGSAANLEIVPPESGILNVIAKSDKQTFKIDCGNSGTLLYFLSVIFSFCEKEFLFLGDASLSQRPLTPLLEFYKKRQLTFQTSDGNLPLVVTGKACSQTLPLVLNLAGNFSQPISGLFLATAIFGLHLQLSLESVGEAPYLSMTRHWLEQAGFSFQVFSVEAKYFELNACGKKLLYIKTAILADWSAVAFPVLAALSSKSALQIKAAPDEFQGDMKILQFLKAFGAHFRFTEAGLIIEENQSLQSAEIDIADTPDALPALCAIASLASGTSEIKNVEIARYKETNRVKVMCDELSALGVNIRERGNSILVSGDSERKPSRIVVESYGDHRIAMALIAFVLGCRTSIEVRDYECFAVSFPSFLDELKKCGAKFAEVSEC